MWNCSVIQLFCVLLELIPICTVWNLHVQAEKARAVILKKCCRRQLRPHSMGDWTQHNDQLPFHTVSLPLTHQASAHYRVSVQAMLSEVSLECATYQIRFVLKLKTRTLYVDWRTDRCTDGYCSKLWCVYYIMWPTLIRYTTLKTEATNSCETLVPEYRHRWPHMPGDFS